MDLHGEIEALFKRMLKPESIIPAHTQSDCRHLPHIPTKQPAKDHLWLRATRQATTLQDLRDFHFYLSESTPTPSPTECPILRGQKSGNEISQIEGGAANSIKNNKKADNSFELSALVAGEGLEPPTFGL